MSHNPKSGPPPKKQKTEEKPHPKQEEVDVEGEDEQLKPIFDKIEKIQESIAQVDIEKSSEIIQIERKYNEKKKPHFKERNTLLKSIPSFWKTVFLNHPSLSEAMTEIDLHILDAIEELDVDSPTENSGWKISFKLKPNAFLKNTTLVKELYLESEDAPPKFRQDTLQWHPKKQPQEGLFLQWFEKKAENDEEGIQIDMDIGDLIHEVWNDPVDIFFNPPEDDLEDEENQDDDDAE